MKVNLALIFYFSSSFSLLYTCVIRLVCQQRIRLCNQLIKRCDMLDRSEDSINYITRSARAFDYGSYYHQFCDGFTREQTRSKLESDFEICRSESGDLAVGTAKWINEQIDNGLPVCLTWCIWHGTQRLTFSCLVGENLECRRLLACSVGEAKCIQSSHQ